MKRAEALALKVCPWCQGKLIRGVTLTVTTQVKIWLKPDLTEPEINEDTGHLGTDWGVTHDLMEQNAGELMDSQGLKLEDGWYEILCEDQRVCCWADWEKPRLAWNKGMGLGL